MSNTPPFPTDPVIRNSNSDELGTGVPQSAHELKSDFREATHDVAQTIRSEASHLKAQVQDSAHTLRKDAVQKNAELRSDVKDKAEILRQAAAQQLHATGERAKELHATGENYVRQNPTQSLLAAVGVGFLIGLLLRR